MKFELYPITVAYLSSHGPRVGIGQQLVLAEKGKKEPLEIYTGLGYLEAWEENNPVPGNWVAPVHIPSHTLFGLLHPKESIVEALQELLQADLTYWYKQPNFLRLIIGYPGGWPAIEEAFLSHRPQMTDPATGKRITEFDQLDPSAIYLGKDGIQHRRYAIEHHMEPQIIPKVIFLTNCLGCTTPGTETFRICVDLLHHYGMLGSWGSGNLWDIRINLYHKNRQVKGLEAQKDVANALRIIETVEQM